MTIDGTLEIARRYTVYGIRNTVNGSMIGEYENQRPAEFDAILYPNAEVVSWEVLETVPVRCAELPAA